MQHPRKQRSGLPIPAAEDCVVGPLRLLAAFRNAVAGRQFIYRLMDISNTKIFLHTVSDRFPEGILQLRLNDENPVPEACAPSIKQGKINNI